MTGYRMEVSKESTFGALSTSDDLTPILDKMKWTLVEAKHGYFITSDNPLVRQIDPATHHHIYGDHGFMNKTAKITFPLSPKVLLLMSWNKSAPDFDTVGREVVDEVNVVRATHSDRYLFAHIKDKRLAKLAGAHKNSRPDITMHGFGPKEFAPISVARRSKTEK
jgi:hypothetical protein